MEATCLQSELKGALDIVKRQAPSKSILPVLSCVLIKADDGVILTASDLETYVVKKIGAKVVEPGSILIPAGLLSEFIASLPNEPVTFVHKKGKVAIQCGRFKANINSMDADDYPQIPSAEPSFQFDADVLRGAINKVAYAAAKDDARPVLRGISFAGGENLCIIAADGFRLAVVTVPINSDGFKVIVPARSAKELAKLITGTVKVGTNNNIVMFQSDGLTLGSRLIEGDFPAIERVVPKAADATTIVRVSTDALMRAARTAGIFATDNGAIRLAIGHSVTVRATGNESGDNTSDVDASVSGPDLEIGVNHQYLLEMLASMPDEVVFYFTSASSPMLIHPVDDDSLTAVCMPMNFNK